MSPSCPKIVAQKGCVHSVLFAMDVDDIAVLVVAVASVVAASVSSPERVLHPAVRRNFFLLPGEVFYQLFRFDKDSFQELVLALQLEGDIITPSGNRCTSFDALFILLHRLAYPSRWADLVEVRCSLLLRMHDISNN